MANNTGLKYGGRTKGTPNKMKSTLRATLRSIVEGELENIQATFDSLKPEKKLDFIAKILPFVLPKAEYRTKEENNTPPEFVIEVSSPEMSETMKKALELINSKNEIK